MKWSSINFLEAHFGYEHTLRDWTNSWRASEFRSCHFRKPPIGTGCVIRNSCWVECTLFRLCNSYFQRKRNVCGASSRCLPFHSCPIFMDDFHFSLLVWLFPCRFTISFNRLGFIAVVMHVALDVLNAYGTKALIPFTNKWISLNFIPLFDPFFLLHLGGLLLWIAGVHPQPVFLYVYAFSVLYIAFRYAIYLLVRKRNEFKDHTVLRFSLTPSIRPWVWDFVIEREREFNVGLIFFQSINWIHTFKEDHEKSDYMKLALENQNAKHFLANAQFPYMIEIQHHDVTKYKYLIYASTIKSNILFWRKL